MIGKSPKTSVELGLRLVSFRPKQQCASLHQLDLKRALTEAQVLQNSSFPRNYMAMYTLLQPHLVFPFPALISVIMLKDVDLTQSTPLTKEYIRRQILQAAAWLGDTT